MVLPGGAGGDRSGSGVFVLKAYNPIGRAMIMETRVEYVVRKSMLARQKEHRCPGCFTLFGTEVLEGSLLLIGNHLARRFSGSCGNCGGELEWSSVDRYMNRITKRARAR